MRALLFTCFLSAAAGCWLAAAGCGSGAVVSATADKVGNDSAAATEGGIDCQALADAQLDLGLHVNFMLRLDTDLAYKRLTDPEIASAFKLDPARLRRDLEVLSVLPDDDSPDAICQPWSQALPELRELADVLEANLASGKPFSDGSGGGEKLLAMAKSASVVYSVTVDDAMRRAGCQ